MSKLFFWVKEQATPEAKIITKQINEDKNQNQLKEIQNKKTQEEEFLKIQALSIKKEEEDNGCIYDQTITNKLDQMFPEDNQELLGEGGQGKIFGWKNKAVKKMSSYYKEQFDEIMNEIKIMKGNALSVNLMSLCKFCCYYSQESENKHIFYIIMDRKKSDLSKLIKSKNFHWKTSRLWKVDMMIRMTRALIILHEQGYIHRDLKLDNFLMENSYYPVLGDFGYSVKVTDIENKKVFLTRAIGTPGYYPPEIKETEQDDYQIPYSFKSDIFSLGICFYRVAMDHIPNDEEQIYIYSQSFIGSEAFSDQRDKDYSIYFAPIVVEMTKVEPQERTTLENVLNFLIESKKKIIEFLDQQQREKEEEAKIKEEEEREKQMEKKKPTQLTFNFPKPKKMSLLNPDYSNSLMASKEDYENDQKIYKDYLELELSGLLQHKNLLIFYDILTSEYKFIEIYFPQGQELIKKYIVSQLDKIRTYNTMKFMSPLVFLPNFSPFFDSSAQDLLKIEIENDYNKILSKEITPQQLVNKNKNELQSTTHQAYKQAYFDKARKSFLPETQIKKEIFI